MSGFFAYLLCYEMFCRGGLIAAAERRGGQIQTAYKGTPSLTRRPLFENSPPDCFQIHPLRGALRLNVWALPHTSRGAASGLRQGASGSLHPAIAICPEKNVRQMADTLQLFTYDTFRPLRSEMHDRSAPEASPVQAGGERSSSTWKVSVLPWP